MAGEESQFLDCVAATKKLGYGWKASKGKLERQKDLGWSIELKVLKLWQELQLLPFSKDKIMKLNVNGLLTIKISCNTYLGPGYQGDLVAWNLCTQFTPSLKTCFHLSCFGSRSPGLCPTRRGRGGTRGSRLRMAWLSSILPLETARRWN